jgi:hypothetical protein
MKFGDLGGCKEPVTYRQGGLKNGGLIFFWFVRGMLWSSSLSSLLQTPVI